jgi:DNA repair protein RecO (recombination protein O)
MIVAMLSREQGVLRAVVKGARDPKKRIRALLDPGTALTVQLYLKKSGLHLVKELSARGRLPLVSRDLSSLALRMAALELVLITSREEGALEGLYELLEDYLGVYETEGPPPWLAFFSFEAHLLLLHGLLPSLELCGVCGEEIGEGSLRFMTASASFVCRSCHGDGIDLAPAEGDCLVSLLREGPGAQLGREVEPSLRKKLGRLLHHALGMHLPSYRLPRSLDLIRSQAPGKKEDA